MYLAPTESVHIDLDKDNLKRVPSPVALFAGMF